MLLAVWLLAGCQPSKSAPPPSGSYRGEIDTPGGPVTFGVHISSKANDLFASIRCGGHSWQITETTWDGQQLTMAMPEFGATIVAMPGQGGSLDPSQLRNQTITRSEDITDGNKPAKASTTNGASRVPDKLSGEYLRVRSADETARLKFRLSRPLPDPPPGDPTPFVGRFSLQFADSNDAAVAIFSSTAAGNVTGTIMTKTGDYRYLGGSVDRVTNKLRLSVFDGGHVFLITASANPDGSLTGDFWSGDWYHTSWTAVPDNNAKLPSGFGLSQLREGQSLTRLQFPDSEGNSRNLGDKSLLGKVTIIELFGTWCPNCHDAASLLGELQTEYKDRGLSVVGLAFELTGDTKRDSQQVSLYQSHFKIKYPILIAGVADKEKATQAFPMLEKVNAYPTFLFVDSSGHVQATYTGFSGPATGQAYEDLKSQFREQIEKLLEQ